MPQLDIAGYAPQLVWLAITFIALYVLMARLALPRVASVLEERTRRREDDLASAEDHQGEAEAVAKAYEGALANARETAHGRLTVTTDQAKAQAEAEIAKLDDELKARTTEAEAGITAARTEALKEAGTIAAEAARLAAERIAGLAVSESEARDAVERDAEVAS
jgi:F-type H+-transporting ATPase subunit b